MGLSNVHGVPGRVSGEARGELLDGRAVSEALRGEIAAEVARAVAEGRRPPGLATILVGSDPASEVYVGAKHRACEAAGVVSFDHRLPADPSPRALGELIEGLNEDPEVDGILLQLPLPPPLRGADFIDLIDPDKDVDGLTAANAGRLWQGAAGLVPCTPLGVIELLDRGGIELEGRDAVIVGRSELVGKPLAALLLARNATVTVCHSRTRRLEEKCRAADILVAALGVPKALGADHVRPGATVVDVGINRTADGLVGDVDFDAVRDRAKAITPVPGGVGPMTIACLLANTVRAAAGRGDAAG
jgi:methylenetetrahydrofolate dehydrogenase (NADP+)/methenyltetrahydrofolate cyclohydrolase